MSPTSKRIAGISNTLLFSSARLAAPKLETPTGAPAGQVQCTLLVCVCACVYVRACVCVCVGCAAECMHACACWGGGGSNRVCSMC